MRLDSPRVAQEAAVAAALEKGATLDIATVSATSAGSVSLLLADGATVHGVTVLNPFVPRVGDVVRIARQGALTVVLGGVGVPTARVRAWESAGTASITSTTLAAIPSPGPWFTEFVAGRSGAVIVQMRARITPTATARGIVAARIVTNTGLTVVATDVAMLDAPAGGGAIAAGSFSHFTGLTPGVTYRAEMIAATGTAGQTITLQNPRILVQPVP